MSKRKMLTDCPDLMRQWDYAKNGDVLPEKFTAGSGYKAWWVCKMGHSWQTSINKRHQGTGCPYCTNRLVLKGFNDLKTLNPELALQWNYKKNGALTPEDVTSGTHRKVWWSCSEGHEWEAVVVSRVAGEHGCPYCAGLRAIKGVNDLETLRSDLASQFDSKKNQDISLSEIAIASNKRLWWLCDKGHSWQATANTRQKSGCPVCAGKAVLAGYNDLQTLNQTLAAEWDYDKNTLKPTEVTLTSGKRVWWRCSKGHSWITAVAHRKHGSICPYCSGRTAITGENDLATVRPDIAAEWDYDKNGDYTPEQFLPQSGKAFWWKCKHGHSWKVPIQQRYIGTGCPYCAGQIVIKGQNDLRHLYPQIAEQWDYEKNNKNSDEFHAQSNQYAWWLCADGHSWRAIIANRTKLGRGCPYCAGKLAIPGETDLLTLCPELATEWDYDKNTVDIWTVTEFSHTMA
jgi:DNA-directed RNA polymerase subunit RPC12/RpoP